MRLQCLCVVGHRGIVVSSGGNTLRVWRVNTTASTSPSPTSTSSPAQPSSTDPHGPRFTSNAFPYPGQPTNSRTHSVVKLWEVSTLFHSPISAVHANDWVVCASSHGSDIAVCDVTTGEVIVYRQFDGSLMCDRDYVQVIAAAPSLTQVGGHALEWTD